MRHELEPGSLSSPAPQSVQLAMPPRLKVFFGQEMHSVPSPFEKLPAPHLEQLDEPVSLATVPGVQAEQASATASEYWPRSHKVQFFDPAADHFPASQASHEDEPNEAVNEPPLQGEQLVPPALPQKLPISHFTQSEAPPVDATDPAGHNKHAVTAPPVE